jgi:hypothetical protein
MDAGMWNLTRAFYGAVEGRQEAPLRGREILLVSKLMDQIFQQITPPGQAAHRG